MKPIFDKKIKSACLYFLFLFGQATAFAQSANVAYEVRAARVNGTCGSSVSGSSCWESSDLEYTALLRVDNPGTGATNCLQGNISCSGDYGVNTVLRTQGATNVNSFTLAYDVYEDDGGSRCTYDSGDDCRAVGSYSVDFMSGASPAVANSYGASTSNEVYNSGGSQHTIYLNYSWRYTGTGNLITPSCAVQTATFAAGGIRSWSVNLVAGVQYNFNTCSGTSNDTYLRIYGADGYTGAATNDDGCSPLSSLDFTPTTSGTYYVEVSQYPRTNLATAGTLSYRINPPSTSSISVGNQTICAGTNTIALGANTPALGTGTWSSSGAVTFSGVNNPASTATSNTAGTSTLFWTINHGGCTSASSINLTVQSLSTAPTTIAVTGTGATLCNGQSSTLTASGGTAGTGANFEWFAGSCASGVIGTGASLVVSPTANTTYFVRRAGTCNTTTCISQAISVNQPSTAPTIATLAGVYCPNTSLVLNAAGGTAGTGSNIFWYDAPNGGGTALGTGASITVTPNQTTTYYARRQGVCNTTTDDSETATIRSFVYAANGTSANQYCTDNSGWSHFYNGSSIILSVFGNLSGVSSMTATIRTNPSFYQTSGMIPYTCANGWSPSEEKFEMGRSWNIDYAGTLSGTYQVRFYYPTTERTAVETAAANWKASYPSCDYSYKYNASTLGWFWFKNSGTAYTPPQYEGTTLTTSGLGTTPNGLNYNIITGISSFSGGSGGVILVPNPALPIELSSFTGKHEQKNNILDWITQTETNNAYFEIERSADAAQNFVKIAQKDGHGTTTQPRTYQFVDAYPLSGVNYYRLKQVDFDGTFSYSNIIAVNAPVLDKSFSVFPNPAQERLQIQYNNLTQEAFIEAELYNGLGQLVKSQKYNTQAGSQLLNFDLNGLADGAYLLRIYTQNRQLGFTTPILKQNP